MEIVRDCENPDIGGKAANLCRLKQFCTVPDFFVLRLGSPDELDDAGNQRQIRDECERRGFGLLAVRSSASCEDSNAATFAGVFETRLGVSVDKVVEAVRVVLESRSRPRVHDYRNSIRVPSASTRMHAIVQRLIPARVSGVCITRMPDDRTMVIEACLGLGEALVGGRTVPDRCLADRATLRIIQRVISYQHSEVTVNPELNGLESHPLPFHRRNAPKLTQQEMEAVASMALLIEQKLGFACADVEWSYSDTALYILQARSSRLPEGHEEAQ